MKSLPHSFLTTPIAHRGFHNRAAGRVENSRAAFRAAVDAGYGIELDVQRSADGWAMVFHDYDLARLTGAKGAIQTRSAAELGALTLTDTTESIPTLLEVLGIVAGKVPLLIEVKDQDGNCGPNVGPLEEAVAVALAGYGGPVAVMSFNPHSVAAMARLAPSLPRGLTVGGAEDSTYMLQTPARRVELAEMADYDRTGSCFISQDYRHLGSARVAELKARGAAILCWTIRSPEAEAEARKIAQNITFEGYDAAIPA